MMVSNRFCACSFRSARYVHNSPVSINVFEVAHGSVGTAVLATGFRVGWPVHVGQERHFFYPQAVNDDMNMNVAAVVMPVWVGAYKGLVAGEMLGAKLLAQCLRPVYGQTVVRPVPWSKLMI